MPDWRKPTEMEAEIILEQERSRVLFQRMIVAVFCLLGFLVIAFFIVPYASRYGMRDTFLIQHEEVMDTTPGIIGTAVSVSSVYFLYFLAAEKKLKNYRSQEYEVVLGDCIDKRNVHSRYRTWYYLKAQLDDNTNLDAICSRKVFRMSNFRSKILIVHLLPDDVSGEQYFRAFVVSGSQL